MPPPEPRSFFPLPDPPRAPRPSRGRIGKTMSVLAILGVLALVAVGIAAWRFDANAYKSRIEAAVTAATGRQFTIRGKLSVVSWFTPTVAANDVVLANLPGRAEPAMIKAARIEADLALRPLLSGRLEIARLAVIAPDVLLETDAAGVPNWHFTPTAASPSTSPASASAAPARPPLSVRTLHIKEGRVIWRDDRTGASTTIGVRRLSATESAVASQIDWVSDLQLPTGQVEITGRTGPLLRLLDAGATTPWSVFLQTRVPGSRVTIAGSLRDPLHGAGYDVLVDADITTPRALATLLGLQSPPLRGMTLSAHVIESATGQPRLTSATLRVSSSDLSAVIPGLQLDEARLDAPAPDQPVLVTLRGTVNEVPAHASGEIGTLAALQAALRARGTVAIDASGAIADSQVAARGTIGTATSGAGLDLALSGRVRDLTMFNPFFPHPLPPLRDLTFSGRITDGPGGLSDSLQVPSLTLEMPEGDLQGTLDLRLASAATPRPLLTARLRGARLDVDALARRLADYSFLPPPPGPPRAALPFPRTVRPLISDTALDFSGLEAGDLDLSLALGEADIGGLPFKDLAATIRVKDGALLAEPVRANLPGGPVDLRFSLDGRNAAQPMALRLHAPGLAVRPLLEVLQRQEDITGTLDLDVNLHAAGASLHAWAATATGHVAASLVDGTIDNAVVAPLFSGVLRVARLSPDLMFNPGRARLRCMALRLDSTDGAARLATFVFDADRALVLADGGVELGPETVNLRLRPTLRVGGPGVVVPLTVTGSFRSPVLSLDKAAISGDVATALAAAVAGNRPRGPNVAPTADHCAAALAVVHGGEAPPGSRPAAPPSPNLQPQRRR